MAKVYLNEFNIRMENSAYLPFSTGMLQANAESKPEIKSNYEFAPFFYHIDTPENVMAQYRNPDVAAFSCWMWNEQLCLTVAAEVKRRWPHCLIIFGGLQVPQKSINYLQQNPFIDIAARADGEQPFTEILKRNVETRDFGDIDNITWRSENGSFIENKTLKHGSRDIDDFQSPYLLGLYENIMDDGRYQMQATVETVRGCPFPCAFCAWGNDGLFRKFRYHSVERFKAEIEWAAQHKIKYVFNADSNFGMHKRDEEIAQILVDTKTKYGYPEKFRTCFGKNADDRIYGIAKKLHDAGMEKGITLALQSNTPQVLKNINRQNIKMETYKYLQTKFNEANVPVYSELIVGMPGETLESWKSGIETLLQSGLQNQLFVYMCQILPNTTMADPEYQKRFGMVTKRIELNEIHGAVRDSKDTKEYEDIIVSTDSMPLSMWREMVLFSWVTMVLHSLKVGFFVLLYLARRHSLPFTDFIGYATDYKKSALWGRELTEFNSQIDRLVSGLGRGRVMPGYSPIYWDEEEASFMRISESLDAFYSEFHDMVKDYLSSRGVTYDVEELSEVLYYQRLRMPSADDLPSSIQSFSFNVPEYFEKIMYEPVELVRKTQPLTIYAKTYHNDKPRFAKETLMWGRKSGTIMTQAA